MAPTSTQVQPLSQESLLVLPGNNCPSLSLPHIPSESEDSQWPDLSAPLSRVNPFLSQV